MDTLSLTTARLLLRRVEETDIEALFELLKDVEVNTFLPWFPLTKQAEAKAFFKEHILNQKYFFAICLLENNAFIGYIKVATDDSYDFGYALKKAFWHKGMVTEASMAVIALLKKDGIPYITATHDINNPRSGGVMRQIGMKYAYSYKEQWQPKDMLVTFRMYQRNLLDQSTRVYKKYWNRYEDHFIETER